MYTLLITILMAGLLAALTGLTPAQAQEAVLPGAPTHDWFGWDSLGRPGDQRQFLPQVFVR